jgi:membrane protease YdiL (CAAX protease family)
LRDGTKLFKRSIANVLAPRTKVSLPLPRITLFQRFDGSNFVAAYFVKSCPYCGKEYPDESTLCSIDGEPLAGGDPLPQTVVEQKATNPEKPVDLIFPEYQWSARDAWKCSGMMLVFGFMVELALLGLNLHFPVFRSWFASGFGFVSRLLLFYIVGLLVAAYFARTETLAMFWKGFGLDRKPTENAWFGVATVIIVRLFGHFVRLHWRGKGVPTDAIHTFYHSLGLKQLFFLLPLLLLAPPFEESIFRGFLYKAFRGSYSVGVSMVLIVVWTILTHWPAYLLSWLGAFELTTLAMVLCYLREKSDSLWDCIICHAIFNGSGLFLDAISR